MINLKILPYLSSKVIVLALFAGIQCFLLLVVIRLGVRYPGGGVFLPTSAELYVTLFLATLAAIGLGLFISASVRSRDMVIYVILIVIFLQIIFAGAIFDLPAAAKPISYLNTTRWTLEAMGSSVNMDKLNELGVSCIDFEDDLTRTAILQNREQEEPCEGTQMRQSLNFDYFVNYEHSAGNLIVRWLVLIAFALLFGGLAYVFQKRKDVLGK
jgi:ABC-type multidrug transport system permease subunit